MDYQQQQIRDQQKASWNKFSAGWKKWDRINMEFLYPVGQSIINSLQLKREDVVLDIASGTGEPGLTIAQIVQKGKVFITDLAEDMLTIAKANISARQLTNIDVIACDVSNLPFEDATFDAVSCRFGFMFFPDMHLAADEMARVLRKSGRIAVSVWDIPEKNFWVTALMGTIAKHVSIPAPLPGSPGMFRCAAKNVMFDIFESAGFRNISQKEIPRKLRIGTIDNYWNMLTEVGAPIVAALANADKATIERIKFEVFELIRTKYPGPDIAIDASALLISAEK